MGVILDKNFGMLSQMIPIFKMGVGAIIGNGKQMLSWIHINDVAKSIMYIINNNLKGPINLVSPDSLNNYTFSKTLGRLLNRPVFFRIPDKMLRIILGEMSALLLNSSNIHPKVLLDSGYKFEFSNLDEALNNLIK